MAELAYNNVNNVNTNYTLFQLNYKYYSHVFYEKDLNQRLKSKAVEKLSFEIQ